MRAACQAVRYKLQVPSPRLNAVNHSNIHVGKVGLAHKRHIVGVTFQMAHGLKGSFNLVDEHQIGILAQKAGI